LGGLILLYLLKYTIFIIARYRELKMNNITFITVTYKNDLERFSLLRESIKRFYTGDAKHIVIVPKNDKPLFDKFMKDDDKVKVVLQNDFVDTYFYPQFWYSALKKIFPDQEWRLNKLFKKFAGVRGWQLQQPIKLSIPAMIKNGKAVILDSDVIFLRSFSDMDFGTILDNPRTLIQIQDNIFFEEMQKAYKLLKLPPATSKNYHYTTMPMIMYPDWIESLQNYIEKIHNKPWQKVLFENGSIHEDCLYGVFIQEILKPDRLFINKKHLSYMVWDKESLTNFLSGDWQGAPISNSEKKPLCVVLQSNLNVSVPEYRSKIENFWCKEL